MTTLTMDIAIPVYNEERRLRAGIEKLHSFLQKESIIANIIIADNGSTDNTRKIAEELCKELAGVRLVGLSQKGVGRALKQVWDISGADIVGYMDVDLSTDINHLIQTREIFKSGSADVVTGSRLIPGSLVVGRKWIREVSSRCFNQILRMGLGVRVSDGMCGFKFITREAYQKLRRVGLENNEWFFNTELLVKAEWAGLRVCEIPVIWRDDPDSKARILELAVKYLKEIQRLRGWKVKHA